MIETWGFYLFSVGNFGDVADVTPEQFQDAYNWYLDLWADCENWGFEGLAWAEHHFVPISLSPSPHLLVAAVASRTKRLRLTTMGSVLSLHDGRRYVEECAMLSYITQGRFEPGIAPGAGTTENVMAGIPAELIRPRYYSAAEVLGKALAGPRVTHHDEFTNLDNLSIVPRLHLRPGQSVWATVMSPDSAVWCAERGYKMCTAWMPTEAAAGLARTYRQAAEAAGNSTSPSMLGLRRRVFVADSDAEAHEKFEAATDLGVTYAGQGFESPDPKILALLTQPDDYVVGSPETVAERFIEQCRAGGYGVAMGLMDNSLMSREDQRRSHELFGTRVAPMLRSADVGSGGEAGTDIGAAAGVG